MEETSNKTKKTLLSRKTWTMLMLLSLAGQIGAPMALRDRDWRIEPAGTGFRYTDAQGALDLPAPSLPGAHQICSIRGDWASFHTSACSRPPPPMTRIFIPGAETLIRPNRLCQLRKEIPGEAGRLR